MAVLSRRALGPWLGVAEVAGAALAFLSGVKFLYILVAADFNVAQAPVAFLVPIAALLVGVALASRRRMSGFWTIGVVSLVLLVVFLAAVMRRGTAQQTWADTLLVFAGIPFALAAVAATVAALRRRP